MKDFPHLNRSILGSQMPHLPLPAFTHQELPAAVRLPSSLSSAQPTDGAQISCLPLQRGPSAWFPVADMFSLQPEELRACAAC